MAKSKFVRYWKVMLKLGFHSSIRYGFQVPLVQETDWAATGAPELLLISLPTRSDAPWRRVGRRVAEAILHLLKSNRGAWGRERRDTGHESWTSTCPPFHLPPAPPQQGQSILEMLLLVVGVLLWKQISRGVGGRKRVVMIQENLWV